MSPDAVPVKVEVVSTVRREERATEPVTITEERRVIVEKPTVQLPPPQPVVAREIDDDWVMLLDAVPLQERAVPSGMKAQSNTCLQAQAYTGRIR